MMSIAVSAVIQPSKVLLAAVGLQCLLVGLVGVLIAASTVGDLRLSERFALAAICLLAAVCAMIRHYRGRQAVQIDISGSGQIRIADIAIAQTMQISQIAYLLQGTTLWPHLLLLRLRLDSGSIRTIAILPDCVPNDTFRVLSVACRWIASRTSKTGSTGFCNE